MTIRRLLCVVLFAALAGGCTVHGSPSLPTASSGVARVPNQAAWRDALARTTLPGAGCFTTAYPATTWTRVPCSAVSDAAFAHEPPAALQPHKVGGAGGQVEGYVTPPATIAEAIGSFPFVKGVTSEYSIPPSGGNSFGPNTFTLQMNAETFATSGCGTNANCVGWEQFVFGNHPPGDTTPSRIFIQDWLLARGSNTLVCPKGWIQSKKSCWHDTPPLVVPYVRIKDLGSLTLRGRAARRDDSIFLTIGTKGYAVRDAQRDKVLDLADHWGEVQFNVLGDGGGSVAVFNPGSTIMVQLQIKTTPKGVQPLCVLTGSSTAESNTLFYSSLPATPQPQQLPSIVYAQSNAFKRGNAQCRSINPAT